MSSIRNIAIIAHVDHGKDHPGGPRSRPPMCSATTAGRRARASTPTTRNASAASIALAKNIAIRYGDVKINVIDTPGHAGFGGEVERCSRWPTARS